MAVPTAAASNYRTQQRIAVVAATAADRLWRRMGADFDSSWLTIVSPLVGLVAEAQLAAAASTERYLERVIYETGEIDLPVGSPTSGAYAGTAADGRSLSGLLYGAVTTAKGEPLEQPYGRHAMPDRAFTLEERLARGGRWLQMTVLTTIADANREATSAGIAMRPAIGGWVRMLNLPSCSRCIILAGKWFRWNEGFQRHPRCDCRHIPSSEDHADDFTTDPYEAFRSMTRAEQDEKFGRSEARAIRDGADINRVVNIRQRGLGTARAARKYGTPSRMTVDDIYRAAGTRTNAIRMLTQEGYITGPQFAGGNIVGPASGFGQLGRGGRARAASNAVLNAERTGQRDQLNRYTMTVGERRIYDVAVRVREAKRGYWVRSIGSNSADRGMVLRPITDDQRVLVQLELQQQLTRLYGDPTRGIQPQPRQVHELARRLGLI